MKLIKYLLPIVLLSSCYTAQKATQQVNKADAKYPEIVAKLARDKYPCTDLLKPDTATIYRDSLVFIDCPEVVPNDYTIGKTDTIRINGVIYRTVKIPVNMPVKTVYVTKWYEDSAKLKLSAIDLQTQIKQVQKLQGENDTLAGKLKTRTKLMWLFVIIALGLTVWTFRKLFI